MNRKIPEKTNKGEIRGIMVGEQRRVVTVRCREILQEIVGSYTDEINFLEDFLNEEHS